MSARHATGTGPSMPVWDPLVRVVHWTLVACVAVAWLTADDGQSAHKIVGYVALAGIVVRLVWGKLGAHYARFGQFVRRPTVVIGYVRQLLAGTAPRYIGHNPLGGWLVSSLKRNSKSVSSEAGYLIVSALRATSQQIPRGASGSQARGAAGR